MASTQYDFQVVASNSFGSTASAIVSATTSAGVSISSVALSPQTFTAGGAQGTIVGSITVTMSSGTFTGSLSVTGTDASIFQISGGNLVLSGAATTARAYNINIVATQSGISNSPFTQNFPSIQATAASQESAEGFTVTSTGTSMFASTNAGFAQSTGPWLQFALVSTGTNDFHISLNGSTAGAQAGTGLVNELIYHNHTAYQANTQGGWWRWDTTGNAWVEFGVSTVSSSGNSYATNAPANTLIGTISVAMKDGTAFSGTLSVDDTTHFKIVGSQLQAATTLTSSSYPITITAVPAVSGANKIGEQGTLGLTVAVTGAFVQVPVGVHTGLGLSFVPSGGSLWSSEIAHYNGFNTAMNRKATVLATILGANTPMDYQPASSPNTWGNGDVGTWTGQGFPSDSSVAPMLHWNFSDGSTSNAFSVYSPANISTSTTFGGQTVAHWITTQLDAWRVNANIRKMYIRINWEWNIGGPNGSEFDVGGSGNIAGWLNAWRGFCNVAHDWGNANAVEVHTVWCPSVFNQATAQAYGQPCIAFFPQPDVNAHAGSDGVTKRYVDVLGLDFYGQVTSDFRPTGYNNYLTNQVWCMPAMHVICQQFNIPFAISECNDQFSPRVTTGYQNWIPNDLVPYLNSLKNLSPAVRIEYITLFDLNVGGTTEFSFSGEASGNLSLFGQAFGGLSASSFGSCPKVTTLAA